MRSNERSLLTKILKEYMELLMILEIEGNEDVSFAKSEIFLDIQNIKSLLNENGEESEYMEILKILKTNYYRLYPIRGGLTEFYIWREDEEDRINANKPLDAIKNELKIIYELV